MRYCRGKDIPSTDLDYLQNELSFLGDVRMVYDIIKQYAYGDISKVEYGSAEVNVYGYICDHKGYKNLIDNYGVNVILMMNFIGKPYDINTPLLISPEEVEEFIKSYAVYYISKYQSKDK